MNEIKDYKINKIRSKVKDRLNDVDLESLFGLVIKKNEAKDLEVETYNIYDKKTGELLVPELKPWDLEDFFKYIGFDIAVRLKKASEIESDDKKVKEAVDILDAEQKAYEDKYYKTCRICGLRYDSSCHAHAHF